MPHRCGSQRDAPKLPNENICSLARRVCYSSNMLEGAFLNDNYPSGVALTLSTDPSADG